LRAAGAFLNAIEYPRREHLILAEVDPGPLLGRQFDPLSGFAGQSVHSERFAAAADVNARHVKSLGLDSAVDTGLAVLLREIQLGGPSQGVYAGLGSIETADAVVSPEFEKLSAGQRFGYNYSLVAVGLGDSKMHSGQDVLGNFHGPGLLQVRNTEPVESLGLLLFCTTENKAKTCQGRKQKHCVRVGPSSLHFHIP